MLLKLSSFFTLALAFPSLNAVNAISPPLVSGKESRMRSEEQLNKRDVNVRFSFYNVGLGTCGETHIGSDFVVALNAAEYGSGSHCFQNITISAQGKATIAQIVDECPSCPLGGLDLSTGLFEFFAPLSDGVIFGDWF